MADMTLKHHRLVADAIAEAVKAIVRNGGEVDTAIRNTFSHFPPDPAKDNLVRSVLSTMYRVSTNELIAAFADKLGYTHDKFDKADFAKLVRDALNVGQPLHRQV